MKTLILTLALIASIHAQTWNCSNLVTTEDGEQTHHDITSSVVRKGTALTLLVKGASPRSYRFLRDTLDGDSFFKLTKGDGMVLIGKIRPDIIAVIDGDHSYMLIGCSER